MWSPKWNAGAMSSSGWLEVWWRQSHLLEAVESIGLTGRRWMLEGVGVTAWDSLDAESLVLAWLGVDQRPGWLWPPERCVSVPEQLIEPTGPLLVRGIWYPVGTP